MNKSLSHPPQRIRLFVCLLTLVSFVSFSIFPSAALAQSQLTFLPPVGEMVNLSASYLPPIIQGLKVFPQDPFRFDFIINTGDSTYQDDSFKAEADTLIKYFLTTLTIPKQDLWVNLSPNEENRIVPNEFGFTEMGRDLLAQDYVLKQLTSSLLYPEKELGEDFWNKIYEEAQEKFHTSDIPMETINKVWIIPEKVTIYENEDTAYITDSKLKVMLEEDYLKMKEEGRKTQGERTDSAPIPDGMANLTADIVRTIIIPAVEKEVNTGAHFAKLRQIFYSMALATWYKRNLKKSILSQIYVEKNKIGGVDADDKAIKEKIYQQYLEAFQKGVYNYVKEDYDPSTQQVIPRKYFSGGAGFEHLDEAMVTTNQFPQSASLDAGKLYKTSARIIVRPLAGNKGVILLADTPVDPTATRAPPRARLLLPAPESEDIVTEALEDAETQPVIEGPVDREAELRRIEARGNQQRPEQETRSPLRERELQVLFNRLSPSITLPDNVSIDDVRRFIDLAQANPTHERSDLFRRFFTDSLRDLRPERDLRFMNIQAIDSSARFNEQIRSIVIPQREILMPNLRLQDQFREALIQRPLIGGDEVFLRDGHNRVRIDDFQGGALTKTFGLEIEFQIADQDERFQRRAMNPANLWQPKWEAVINGLKGALDESAMDWVMDSSSNFANFQEFKIGGAGVENTDGSWKTVEGTLARVQGENGPLQGGVSSVHLHYGYRNARRNSDGTLTCDQKRFGRVVKTYEAMFRALGGRGWSQATAGYVAPLDNVTGDRADLGGGKTQHNRILNLSRHGTIEAKFFEGDVRTPIGEGQKIDETRLRRRTQWGFKLLDFVRSGYDQAPLAILGIPVLAGHKPSQKQIDHFIDLFFEPGSEEADYARETFAGLQDQVPGLSLAQRQAQMREMEGNFTMFGLQTVWNRHMANEGYDENLVGYFLMSDHSGDVAVKDNERILTLAMDLVRAGNTNARALGYFPIEMHEKLKEALNYVREKDLVKKEDIKEIDSEALKKIDWADIFNTANVRNLNPDMRDFIISRAVEPASKIEADRIDPERFRFEPDDFYYVPQNESLRINADDFNLGNIDRQIINVQDMRIAHIDPSILEEIQFKFKRKSRLAHWFLIFMFLSLFLVGDRDRNTDQPPVENPVEQVQVDESAVAATVRAFEHSNLLSRNASGVAVEEFRARLEELYSAEELVNLLSSLEGEINNVTGNAYAIDFDHEAPEDIVAKALEKGTPFGVNLERVVIALQHELGLEEDGDVGRNLRDAVIQALQRKAIESEVKRLMDEARQRRERGAVDQTDSMDQDDQAQTTPGKKDRVGGIDFNADHLYIETTGTGVQLSVPINDLNLQDVNISGVTPVILEVVPVTNLPLLLGLKN